MNQKIRALIAGLSVAFSLPPWGWWPLTFIGLALYGSIVVQHTFSRRQSFIVGALLGIGWFVPSLMWMWFLTAPGYIIVVFLFAAGHGCASLIGGSIGAPKSAQRAVALSLSHTVVEVVRFSFPFGGIPLASLGIAQAASPFSRLAPLGGVVLITYFVFRLSLGARRVRILALIVLLCAIAPLTSSAKDVGARRIAFVQGGGEQGTHAINSNSREVFNRHLAATQSITVADDVDLVVWPENVVDVENFATSDEFLRVGEEARRLGRPILVGVTEQAAGDHFTNAQVLVTPTGQIASRYDKKRRVPFGEYMPLRGILSAIGAPTNLVPRDAIAGQTPAVMDVDGVPVGVVISWEVFFGGRANEGTARGAQLIINPTNGSSYTWSILQSQQVASSRLRAQEQSRWVVQVAPTGFSAFVSPNGRVEHRTSISERKVVIESAQLRTGRTLYSRLGNSSIVLLFLAAFAITLFRAKRPRGTQG